MVKVKICGLYRMEDIAYVNEAKPDYVGFIINFPKSHRNVSLDFTKEMIAKLDSDIKSVCVIVNQPIEDVITYANEFDIIQLHGDENLDYINSLKVALPSKEIWKAFKVKSVEDIENAKVCNADNVLLDSGYGTGKQFDWSLGFDIERNFIVAGGINIDNATGAISNFKPYALDISSGVETEKVKDKNKIIEIVKIIRGAK